MKNAVFWDMTLCCSCKNQRFRGTYRHVPPKCRFLTRRLQKSATQIPKTTGRQQCFKSLHKLPLTCLYMYEILVYIESNLNVFVTNSEVHSHNTKKYDLFIVACNTSLSKNNFKYWTLIVKSFATIYQSNTNTAQI
jgi:hypothetical protein